jgi:glucose/arabinose dehydrogenase
VSVFGQVPNSRLLRFTSTGDLLVSSPRTDSIWRLTADRDGDGRADSAARLPLELDRPHGLDLHAGYLYIGEAGQIRRVAFDEARGEPSGPLTVVVDELPTGGNHWTRTVAIGPDDRLYVTVGSSCNVCIEDDERRAAMLRYELDGSGYELYASGLRNAVDFDWQPETGILYATDNGRDLLGNDFPPCELNRIERGGFYGWPYQNGDNVVDPDYGGQRSELEARALAPAHDFRAHNAPLGIHFVDGPAAPPEYRGAALVGLHGSWNRSEKDGYRVVSLHWNPDGSIEERNFLSGFEFEDDVIGRPVDAAMGPDGAFYVSDDFAGVVWRVARGEASSADATSATAAPTPQARQLPAIDSELAEAGARLYEIHACASCHDPAVAAAGVVAKRLSGLRQRYDTAALADFFTAPTPPMPLFELDDHARAALASFLLTEFGE